MGSVTCTPLELEAELEAHRQLTEANDRALATHAAGEEPDPRDLEQLDRSIDTLHAHQREFARRFKYANPERYAVLPRSMFPSRLRAPITASSRPREGRSTRRGASSGSRAGPDDPSSPGEPGDIVDGGRR